MYQRLGLEDDIVDPSNALLREGPVLKISFRRRDPTERYLFLVEEVGGGGGRWGVTPPGPAQASGHCLQEEQGRAC